MSSSAVLGGADPALLDSYGEERIPVARAVFEDSTQKMRRTLPEGEYRGPQDVLDALRRGGRR